MSPEDLQMFEVDHNLYSCLYEYMARSKAELFGDQETLQKIMDNPDPDLFRQFGNYVKNCNEVIWNGQRSIILYRGLVSLYEQHPDLASVLAGTGDEILAFCSAVDKELGTGTWITDLESCQDMNRWTGQNLLGFALMDLRKALQAKMQAAQAEVEASEVEASAGGGAVKVVANGRHEFISVTIDPEVAQDDVEMLQDLMLAACNEAMRKVDELAESKMGAVTGGMGLGF